MDLQIDSLKPFIDDLQAQYGDNRYTALYGTGCTQRPRVMFFFMNPTARNLSAKPDWQGIRASFIGHKQAWQLMHRIGFISTELHTIVQSLRTHEWLPEHAERLYSELADHGGYITSLARCTMPDARALPDTVFQACRAIALTEISLVQPQSIIAFGNQVASNLLQQPITMSMNHGQRYDLAIDSQTYPVYPTYYPVGMGFRNIDHAVNDIRSIMVY